MVTPMTLPMLEHGKNWIAHSAHSVSRAFSIYSCTEDEILNRD